MRISKKILTLVIVAITPIVGWQIYLNKESRSANKPKIHIVDAFYGKNCSDTPVNARESVRMECDDSVACDYTVDVNILGDPKQGCGKDFIVRYTCGDTKTIFKSVVHGEAGLGGMAKLSCSEK